MSTFTPNLELRQDGPNDPIDPMQAFSYNFGKISSLYGDGHALSSGIAVCDRRFADGNVTTASGEIYFSYFTAYRGSLNGGIVGKVQLRVGSQAGSGLTLAKIGLYTVGSGDQSLALVASTANDTTGWTSTFSGVTKNLSSSYTLQVTNRYAIGVLFIGTTPPNYVRAAGSTDFALNALPPRICGKLTGQSDLPSSVTDGSLSTTGAGPFAILLP